MENKDLKSWNLKQAVAILAVDNIKVSNFGMDLLKRIENGEITFEQAREEVRNRAKEYSSKSSKV